MSDPIIPFIWFCVAAIGVCIFRCVASVAHLFYISRKVIYKGSIKTSQSLFTKLKKCDIIKMRNKLNMTFRSIFV